MTQAERKAIAESLEEFQQHIFDQGHNFWFCDAQDEAYKTPFYYYQRNHTRHMATCSNCQTLMDNRRKIRGLQKQLGLSLTPFHTKHREKAHVKRMIVSSSSMFNPNYSYL